MMAWLAGNLKHTQLCESASPVLLRSALALTLRSLRLTCELRDGSSGAHTQGRKGRDSNEKHGEAHGGAWEACQVRR